MKKAIIIGASSGIGRALAIELTKSGYQVGITGRRKPELETLKSSRPESFQVSAFDATSTDCVAHLESLATKLGGLDLVVISSGIGELNPVLDFKLEQPTISLNVKGFTEITNWAFNHFKAQGTGHITAITSIAGLRGGRHAPAYNASKAYQINYLEGLRQKAVSEKLEIRITDVRPGFVDTAMAKGEGQFWVASPEKVAHQIMNFISRKKDVGYVTKRWIIFAWLLKTLPRSFYKRF